MNRETVTLGELNGLLSALEDGGATGLTTVDLAFLGRTIELIVERAHQVQRKVEVEVSDRLQAREADLLAENGSSIKRTWKNEYKPDLDRLVQLVMTLDVEFASEVFEFVPASQPPPPPPVAAHWKLKGNISKVVNWAEKLGLSGSRQALTDAIGQTKVQPKFIFKAIDPETGEVL